MAFKSPFSIRSVDDLLDYIYGIPDWSPRQVNIVISFDMNENSYQDYSQQITKQFPVTGLAAENFLTINRNSDLHQSFQGVAGEVAVCYSPDKSGTVELTLMQTSNSNLLLSNIYKNVDLSFYNYPNLSTMTLTISDDGGNNLAHAKNIYLLDNGTQNLGKSQKTRTWTFASPQIVFKDEIDIESDKNRSIIGDVLDIIPFP
jgi:hypothetical protein